MTVTAEWDVPATLDWLASRPRPDGDAPPLRVALQWPDALLGHALGVAEALRAGAVVRGLSAEFFVVADSTFNPAALDEVTAIDHGRADVAVHYGPASLARPARLPARFVFSERPAPVDSAALAAVARSHAASLDGCTTPALVLLLDQRLDHAADAVEAALAGDEAEETGGRHSVPVVLGRAAGTVLEPGPRPPSLSAPEPDGSVVVSMAGLTWRLPPGAGGRAAACAYLWAAPAPPPPADGSGDAGNDDDGDDDGSDPWAASLALDALHLALAGAAGWASVAVMPDAARPYTVTPGLPPAAPAAARRRYFLIHKARAATIVGILITALGDPAVVAEAEALRAAAMAAGKTAYTFVIGRPTPFKLANFPEIDAWVAVAESGPGQLVGGQGKDWLAPVVTPHEARLAWGAVEAGGGGREDGGSGSEDDDGGRDPLDGWDPATYRFDEPGEARGVVAAGRSSKDVEDASASVAGLALVPRGGRAVGEAAGGGSGALSTVRTGADFLNSRRTWRGLETPEVGADAAPAAAVGVGRAGRAAGYEGEG